MYELEIMTIASKKLLKMQNLFDFDPTSSTQFNAAWESYVEKMTLGNHNQYYRVWATTVDGTLKHITHATHTPQNTANAINAATRLISMGYILCADQLARLQVYPTPTRTPDKTASGEIVAHVVMIDSLCKNMRDFTEKNVRRLNPGEATLDAIREFYTVALVALHETRPIVSDVFDALYIEAIARAENQLSKYGLVASIPQTIFKRIEQQRVDNESERDLTNVELLVVPERPLPRFSGTRTAPQRYEEPATVLPFDGARDRIRQAELVRAAKRVNPQNPGVPKKPDQPEPT